jgi:hypothetical protein
MRHVVYGGISTHGTRRSPIRSSIAGFQRAGCALRKVFAYNLDLFIQHGSTPAGDKPVLKMAAWGDSGTLTQQQIADVIAYIMSLNPAK